MGDCEGELHPHARRGIALFNEGRYFEAHEELEIAWRAERGRIRELYQGILEAGVTYLHIRRKNYAGAMKVYERSMRWLRDWPSPCRGADVGQLRQDMAAVIAEARRLGSDGLGEFSIALLKPIRVTGI
jgi:predicted metal-dependent hydrolase